MNASNTGSSKSNSDSRSASEIERDLASNREELGETLEALSEKLDVKTRFKDWSLEAFDKTQHRIKVLKEERGRELAIAGSAVGALVLARLVKRARHR